MRAAYSANVQTRILSLIVLTVSCQAQSSPLFGDDAVLDMELSGPFSTLIDAQTDSPEQPFVLRANGTEHRVAVRVRGKSRLRVCDFPPLRVNFSKDRTGHTVFLDQDKLKLVTHCKDSAYAQTSVLKEYAAYRIFNLISDISYKVRLLRIQYNDTDGRMSEKTFVRYGYFIQSASELADSVGGRPVEVPAVSMAYLDTVQSANVFVFQYLIGNTDWSLVTADVDSSCCHNGDLIEIGSKAFHVPYDFDQSGLANARYARPDSSLRISKVTQRLYRGYCISPDALRSAILAIAERKDDILGVVPLVPGLAGKDVATPVRFLERYFDLATDVDKLTKSFDQKCL
jgi:hypothetical protein